MNGVVDEWEARWRKGTLPVAILAVLRRGPMHGYAIAAALRDLLGAAVPEGTLYPLLNSFDQDGLAASVWATQEKGPARKTYSLTRKGRSILNEAERSWREFNADLERLFDDAVD